MVDITLANGCFYRFFLNQLTSLGGHHPVITTFWRPKHSFFPPAICYIAMMKPWPMASYRWFTDLQKRWCSSSQTTLMKTTGYPLVNIQIAMEAMAHWVGWVTDLKSMAIFQFANCWWPQFANFPLKWRLGGLTNGLGNPVRFYPILVGKELDAFSKSLYHRKSLPWLRSFWHAVGGHNGYSSPNHRILISCTLW